MSDFAAKMKILDIIPGTSVDGPGLRTAIYFAGCAHHCPGCQNPQSWDFDSGIEMSMDELIKHIVENDFDVTLTGGDPLYQSHYLLPLLKKIKELGKSIWVYTGFRFEEILSDEIMRDLLPYIDVVVDGPYIEAQRDLHLRFKGSANQRLIDVKKSLGGRIVEWGGD